MGVAVGVGGIGVSVGGAIVGSSGVVAGLQAAKTKGIIEKIRQKIFIAVLQNIVM
jgi:F0F1-type ATP synthase membrane subunit c/vacuolar-type H+-ATPase subunit K